MSIDAPFVLRTLLGPLRRAPGAGTASVAERVRKGLPASVIERLATAYATTNAEVQRLLGISRATAQRKRSAARAILDPVHSDRALRLARVLSLARSVFEDDAAAARWFKEQNRALAGERPFDLLDTEDGTERVVTVLNRIEYGVYS